jgi:hypothetical protein
LYMKKRHMAKPNDKDVQSVQEEWQEASQIEIRHCTEKFKLEETFLYTEQILYNKG